MQGSRLRSAYCYWCTVWPAALCGLCSKAKKKKTLAQWETLVELFGFYLPFCPHSYLFQVFVARFHCTFFGLFEGAKLGAVCGGLGRGGGLSNLGDGWWENRRQKALLSSLTLNALRKTGGWGGWCRQEIWANFNLVHSRVSYFSGIQPHKNFF